MVAKTVMGGVPTMMRAETGFRDEGASAVEFALVAMVLVTLLLGIAQFGVTFYHYLEVAHSAREGARWASLGVDEGSISDPVSVKGRVAAAAGGLDGLTDGDITITTTPGAQPAVTVTVQYDSPIFTPFIGSVLGGTDIHLTSSATLRVEDGG